MPCFWNYAQRILCRGKAIEEIECGVVMHHSAFVNNLVFSCESPVEPPPEIIVSIVTILNYHSDQRIEALL